MKNNNDITDITKYLKPGKANAVSAGELMRLCNCKSKRELQTLIAAQRKAGTLICSGGCPGYWLPADREEIEEFIASMESRGKNIFAAIKSARLAIKDLEGQTCLQDFGE